MCGVVGIVAQEHVNQTLYDALLLLQHRGQDAAGMATCDDQRFALHKENGLVRDAFRTRDMRSLPGTIGIAQVRYPTAGAYDNEAEAQPFYVNAPFGIMLAHNGNLTNWRELQTEIYQKDRRHINTQSDSEVLLNIFANALNECTSTQPTIEAVFSAVTQIHSRLKGSYAVVALIAGFGLVAFRDPFGIRPLIMGRSKDNKTHIVASESVAIEGVGHQVTRDISPGEAVCITLDGQVHARQCAAHSNLTPCLFEYVYLARPDSTMNGVSVYAARAQMGQTLARRIAAEIRSGEIDVVMPIPDSSRPAAIECASALNLKYREGFIKNRYIGRTFIMPGQAVRTKSVRQKLNPIGAEFAGKSVLLIDDSIVRGTTSREIIQMARAAGARRVIFASAAPPVRYSNVYGIDMPTRHELIAHGRSIEQICHELTADQLVFQDQVDLENILKGINPKLNTFEASCFDGNYITGDVSPDYLHWLEQAKNARS